MKPKFNMSKYCGVPFLESIEIGDYRNLHKPYFYFVRRAINGLDKDFSLLVVNIRYSYNDMEFGRGRVVGLVKSMLTERIKRESISSKLHHAFQSYEHRKTFKRGEWFDDMEVSLWIDRSAISNWVYDFEIKQVGVTLISGRFYYADASVKQLTSYNIPTEMVYVLRDIMLNPVGADDITKKKVIKLTPSLLKLTDDACGIALKKHGRLYLRYTSSAPFSL